MKAALCRTLDGPDAIVIEDIADPVAGQGQVVVRVEAAALNFLDTLITRGKYQYKPELPFSPAAECAGVVDAIGSGVTEFSIGDPVCGYLGWGAAREKVAVEQHKLVRRPAKVDAVTAAGIPVAYGTALHGLQDRARVLAGETVAVLGAAGGAGLAAVEVAKAMGARVVAVASSEDKLALCREHGADESIDYSKLDLKQALRDTTQGRGVDVVYDCVGGPHAEAALRSIAWGGRYLVVGFAAGEIPRIPINLLLLKNAAMLGVFWGEMTLRDPAAYRAGLARILAWIDAGELAPHNHAVYPLERIGEAIGTLTSRSVRGKVVVRI